MELGISLMVWALASRKVIAGYCIRAKHNGGNKIFMASNAAPAPVALTVAATEGAKLDVAGAIVSVKDCSDATGTTIKAYTIK